MVGPRIGFGRLVLSATAALMLAGCQSEIIGNLDQHSAREIERVLLKSGIRPDVSAGKNGTFSISVDQSAQLQALSIIADAGLPQTEYATLDKVFPGNGFLVTPIEQRARLTFALEQELAHTLSSMEGVRSARVHIVTPEDSGRGFVKQKARAAALIVYRLGADTGPVEQKARTLILNSVSDLDFEDVSIVLSAAPDEEHVAADHVQPTVAISSDTMGARIGIAAIAVGLALAAIGAVRLVGLPKRRPRLQALPRKASPFLAGDR